MTVTNRALIVAAFRSQDPFPPPRGSLKSTLATAMPVLAFICAQLANISAQW